MSSLDDGAGPELGEDDPTPTQCLACGGRYEISEEGATGHSLTRCRWCIRGAQTRERLQAWLRHRATAPR